MALGRQGDRQGELMVTCAELPRSPGHVFYDRLQRVLIDADFDGFAEKLCAPYSYCVTNIVDDCGGGGSSGRSTDIAAVLA